MKYDVFLYHANVDKDSFVETLKRSFDQLGISIFYGKDSIEWGDDWKQKIYDGLSNCKYGVIVVSENFLDRKWTEKELKELLSRQSETGGKLILPIAYNINVHHYVDANGESFPHKGEGIDLLSFRNTPTYMGKW